MSLGVLDSTTHKTLKDEISTTWTVENARACFNALSPAAAQQTRTSIESPAFGNGRWKLAFVERRQGDPGKGTAGEIEIRLVAVFGIEDTHGANSKTAWIRTGRWSAKFQVTLSSQAKPVNLVSKAHEYSSKSSAHGKVVCHRYEDLISLIKQDNKVVVSCTVNGQGVGQSSLQRPYNPIGALYFDSPQYADVVLTFPDSRRIFASQTVLGQASSRFQALLASKSPDAPKAISINIAAPENHVFDSQATFEVENMGVFPLIDTPASRGCKKRKVAGPQTAHGRATSQAEFRSMLEIKMGSADFTTVRALLAYLYTGLLPFLALPSDYLVALDHARSIGGETTRFPSPGQWIQERFEQLPEQPKWTGISPCSPHALYRLGDEYAIDEVKAIALGRILRSLTVENVSYELFSPLSVEDRAVQDAVFSYFASHWVKVRSTRAWHQVHDKIVSGQLAHASTLIKRVWDIVPLAPAGNAALLS